MDSTTNQFAGAAAGALSTKTAPLPAMLADAFIGAGAGGGDGDPNAALQRLAALGDRMAAVRRLLFASISGESQPLSSSDIQSVSSEISSAAHLVVLNAASLLSSSLPFPVPSAPPAPPAPIQELPAAASTTDVLPKKPPRATMSWSSMPTSCSRSMSTFAISAVRASAAMRTSGCTCVRTATDSRPWMRSPGLVRQSQLMAAMCGFPVLSRGATGTGRTAASGRSSQRCARATTSDAATAPNSTRASAAVARSVLLFLPISAATSATAVRRHSGAAPVAPPSPARTSCSAISPSLKAICQPCPR
ncbi:Protein SENSITIVE TO PROTON RHIZOTOXICITY 1 [Hordeum vulgare]|nr:Protein SENSITIVE TO PROTON RHIZOTOXICITY 1 [Hordeum vulgare]